MKIKAKIPFICLLAVLLTALAAGITVYASSTVTDSDWITEPPKKLIKCEGGGCDHTACDYAYSFAVVGDTQSLSYIDAREYTEAKKKDPTLTYGEYTQARMRILYNWILNNKESKNIQYVLGVGDVTQSNTSTGETYIEEEWALSKEAIALMDGKIGYSLARGNHDLPEDINAAFGIGSRYRSDLLALSCATDPEGRAMAGFLDTDRIEDTYRKISVGEEKYIIFTLDYYPSESCAEWLDRILTENSDYTAIITTHAFLYKDNAIFKPNDTHGGISPRELWEKTLSRHENVKLVISGHVSVDDIAVNRLVGEKGNTVTLLLTDGQDIDETVEPVGLVTMLYFSADGKTLSVEQISTVRASDGRPAFLKESNQFQIKADLSENGQSGWTETKYGNVPTAELDSNVFHILLDDDSDPKTDAFHMGSYSSWTDTLNAIHAYNGIGDTEMRAAKTYYILMTEDYVYSDGTAPAASNKNPGKTVLDLNGNTLTVSEKGLFLPIYTATNKYVPSFSVINGSVLLQGSRPFAVLQTAKAVNGAEFKVDFKALTVIWNGSSVPFLDTYAGQSGYASAVTLTVTDCVFNTEGAPDTVTVFDLKDEYGNCHTFLTVSGSEVTAKATVTVCAANEGDTVRLKRNADGSYLTVTVTEKPSFSESFRNENGETLTYSTSDVTAPYIYRPTVAETVFGDLGQGLRWTLTPDGTLTVTGKGAMPDFNAGEAPWSEYGGRIKALTLGDGIVSVSRCAFHSLTALASVNLPDSLMIIDEYGFYGCSSLESVTLPDTLYYIGAYAFRRSGITTVSAPDGWRASDGAFVPLTVDTLTDTYYKKVLSRDPEASETVIADGVFGKNASLRWTLTASGDLTVTGKGKMPTFSSNGTPWNNYRSVIRRVIISEGVTDIGRCSFHTSRPLTELSLPSTLTRIREYAFYGCVSLRSVTLPEGVTEIGKFAFRKCRSLTAASFGITYGWYADGERLSSSEITVAGADMLTLSHYKSVWTRDENAQADAIDPYLADGGACNSRITWRLTYTDEAKTKMKLTVSGTGAMPNYGTAAAPWYKYLEYITAIEVTEGITEIGRCAFYGLKRVTEVTLPEGLTAIGDYAFNSCKALANIHIPNTVTHVSPTAFGKTLLTLSA